MPTQPIKAVLFDLDDTLWPIVPVIKLAETVLYDWLQANAPAVTRQFTIENLRARRMALMSSHPRYRFDLWALRHAALTEAFIATGEDAGKVDSAMAIFSRARNAVTPYEDVLPTLTRLSALVKVGSISNGAADLEVIGLARHFHASIAAHQLGCAKPDAMIFHTACAALQVAPHEAVYVGDDPALDVEGAQKAGLRGIWMNRAGLDMPRTLPVHIQPDAVCTTLYELDRWLAQHIIDAG